MAKRHQENERGGRGSMHLRSSIALALLLVAKALLTSFAWSPSSASLYPGNIIRTTNLYL